LKRLGGIKFLDENEGEGRIAVLVVEIWLREIVQTSTVRA
jgi:hypothetical protein